MLNSAARWLSNSVRNTSPFPWSISRKAEAPDCPAVVGRAVPRKPVWSHDPDGSEGFPVSVTELRRTGTRRPRALERQAFRGSLPNSEPHWRWSDGHMNTRRIHTKEIGEDYEQ